jgi:hypothetical protein
MTRALLTIAALQVGWFACVLGAAGGHPLAGVAIVALVAGVHVATTTRAPRLFWTLVGAAALGVVFDGALAIAGLRQFPPATAIGWPVPAWMVALWVNLGVALPALAWLERRPVACAAIGAGSDALSLEVQSLRSRGDAHLEYQRTTSPFFPWPPTEGAR